jgi:hypothetical protein
VAGAFDSYHDRVVEKKRKRELCRQVVLRIQHRGLAVAFDMFSGTVEQLRAHRTMVEKAMARWRTPVLALMFQEWWGCVEQEKAAIHARAQHEAMTELKQNLEDELASSKTHAEKECERRMGMSKRVVARMLHIQLAQAFDSYSERVQECKERKATCKRLIHRMLHTQLAAAFDCFSEAIEQLAAHRTMVLKATSRWRTPALKEMFERWLDYVDRVKQEAMEEGNALAKREFADQLAKEKSVGEERVQQEQERRMEQARRTVKRMLRIQAAGAFDSFLECVVEKKRKRELCLRVVLRMQHRALAGAFDMFSGTVEQLASHRRVVERAISRWRSPAMTTAMWAWMEYMEMIAVERKMEALEQTKNQVSGAAELEKGELKRVVESEKERRIAQAKRIVHRLQQSQVSSE